MNSRSFIAIAAGHFFILAVFLLSSACSRGDSASSNTFFALTPPPPRQEFRWSNGRMPKHLDPARAASAPETDIVRALFEGLTELDPVTLNAIPAVAAQWTSSDDLKTWTFTLRPDAKWSNGQPVTAHDFVASWSRLIELGDRSGNPQLLRTLTAGRKARPAAAASPSPEANTNTAEMPADPKPGDRPTFRAVDDRTFVVELTVPDKDLPRLVANPLFLPVYQDTFRAGSDKIPDELVSNGAFRLAASDEDSVIVERSETYWGRSEVPLDRVVFEPAANAEAALSAYRAGKLDAVTNADFEPLAIKLLEPFEDFRKGAFAALNFYKVNTSRPPFDDRRVRRALASAIERERLTEGDLAGTTRPAFSFLPFVSSGQTKITQDKQRARDLLEEAGFPDGEGFPTIRLVVNRNDVQQRIARSVARMWKQNLNLETEIIVKETGEIETLIRSGDYDLVRRGVVLPTADEEAGLTAIFPKSGDPAASVEPSSRSVGQQSSQAAANVNSSATPGVANVPRALTEEIAIFELEAIPLYFPTSYSLVKPYVIGFDMNVLDAPLLRKVRIDNSWQPKGSQNES